MPYQADKIADWFLIQAAQEGISLTQMKLQKLVYIAHGWNLAVHNQPLIPEAIEAQNWGPVIRSLYAAFAVFGSQRILATPETPELRNDIKQLLGKVWTAYKGCNEAQLAAITKGPDTPWKKAYNSQYVATIPNDTIAQYYRSLATPMQAATVAQSQNPPAPGLNSIQLESIPGNGNGQEAVALEKSFVDRRQELELRDFAQDIQARKNYANKLFWLVCIWLIAIFAILLLTGYKHKGFILADQVLLALIGGTTVTVIGLFLVVVQYLFPQRKTA